MSHTTSTALIAAGVNRDIRLGMQDPPTVDLSPLVQVVNSKTKSETYAWMGAAPPVYEYTGHQLVEPFYNFQLTIVDSEWRMAAIIHRDLLEDDQTGEAKNAGAKMLEAWKSKDRVQLAALLTGGGSNLAFDGISFFNDAHSFGSSGTIDNDMTYDMAGAVPTSAEVLAALGDAYGRLSIFKDDQGEIANGTAIEKFTVVCPASLYAKFVEATQAAIIANTSNVFGQRFAGVIPLPDLDATSTLTFYVIASGATAKPFIHTMRVKQQYIAWTEDKDIDQNEGLKIVIRERSKFSNGDFTKIVRVLFN